MVGVLINAAAVVAGGLAGLLLKKGVSEKIVAAVMQAIGLCSLYIGISGLLSGSNILVTIVSMVIGTFIGTLLDIDGALISLSNKVGSLSKKKDGAASVPQGFITASLVFCVGAMAITGSLNAGLTGNNDILFTKSLLDLITAVMLAASLGAGVILAAAFIILYEGSIALLAGVLAPLLTETVTNEIICTGSVMIVAIGLNLIGITKLKVANYLPAFIITPIALWLYGLL